MACRARLTSADLFPAQAGVILLFERSDEGLVTFPRASGGDPALRAGDASNIAFSPRKRG